MNGVIIINKPKGYTSHDIVNVVRKQLNIKKVGHTGTLDPNATGVLPILIGQATKISKYLVEHKKTYIATLKLGEKRSTGDSEGEIIEKNTNYYGLDKEKIKETLDSFLGNQKQIPPIYSALKINGKKLYEYARNNKEVEIPSRNIEIFDIRLISYDEESEIVFEVECSKGTYIRVLCEDIAKKLDTVGYMKELQRTKVNEFSIQNAIELENISYEYIKNELISIEDIFASKDSIELNDRKLELFLNGVMLTYEKSDGTYRIYNNKKFIGLGVINNKLLKRDIVI